MARAWILGAQGSHEDRLFAIVIELIVDGAFGKDGSLELFQGTRDFRTLASFDETILKNVTKGQVFAVDKCQELSRAGMYMGGVDAAGFQKAESRRNAQVV